MPKSSIAVSSLLAGLLIGSAVPASAAVIDSFGPQLGAVDSSQPVATSFMAGDAVGGFRSLRAVSPAQQGLAQLAVTAAGELSYTAMACVDCSGRVRWDANGAGLNFFNLLGGNNAFQLDFIQLSADVQLSIDVFDEFGGRSSLSQLVQAFNGPDPLISSFRFSDFTAFGVAPTRFDAVDEIRLEIYSGPRSDVSLRLGGLQTNFLSTNPTPPDPPASDPNPNQVPLPGSLALTLAGLIALGAGLRRQARNR